jgi:uncharacterized membrane protein YjgN (DUF898 family)
MKKEKSVLILFLTWAALAGNILFMLWISYNGIKEHFRGTLLEKISYIGLMGLLAINTILVLSKRAV